MKDTLLKILIFADAHLLWVVLFAQFLILWSMEIVGHLISEILAEIRNYSYDRRHNQ